VARRALEISTAHAIDRIQFERPIGSYQGVSHRVANSYLATELARSLAYWAAWCVAEQDEQAAAACAAAKSSAAEAAVLCCEGAIQVLGGSGFTWEQPLHRFYKRARWLDAFDGHGSTQRAELAEMLLGPVG
jgi:alkylation response protein AidB-like acyl-CoA dehydrogenase